MKKHSVLILILAVCLLFVSSCGAEQRNSALDDAFAKGETLRLLPAELNGNAGQYGMPLDLSPDGKTVLLRNGSGLIVVRDGKTIPVTFNAQRGAGDVYGKEMLIEKTVAQTPAWEGLSWSGDGRYTALSNAEMSMQKMQSFDVAVLDTENGEVFLADTYNRSVLKENGGLVYMNKVDRSGKYLYYMLVERLESGSCLRFCRCPVEGGSREVLYENMYDETAAFDMMGSSDLYEMQDGSWLLSGTDRRCNNSEDWKKGRLAMIRFAPSGSGWTAEVTSLGVSSYVWSYALSGWSAASGYGVFPLQSEASMTASETEKTENTTAAALRSLGGYVNLLRILPGSDMPHDLWYMRKTGEKDEDVELFPADDYLWSLKAASSIIGAGEEQEAAKWAAENAESPDNPLPKGFNYARELQEMTKLNILAACISPDGHYALINAGNQRWEYRLYLVSLVTMQVRPVETPEGVGGVCISRTPLGKNYRPGFVWNDDGTLLVEGKDGVGAYRLEAGPAQ